MAGAVADARQPVAVRAVAGWQARRARRLLRGAATALALVAAAAVAHAAPPPPLTAPVHDLAGVVDADSAARLDHLSRTLQAATGDVIVVLTVRSYRPEFGDIRAFTVKAFENQGRGIGDRDRDNGVLVVLAVDDRQVHIEVGYGLEGAITDGFAGETARLYMRPAFQQGRYGEGLVAGATRLAARIAEERNVAVADLPRLARERPRSEEIQLPTWAVLLAILAIYLLMRASQRSHRGRYTSRPGGGVHWGGSNWSGWSGGGSFGGGSFGGGFGGFGGGGSGGGGGGTSW